VHQGSHHSPRPVGSPHASPPPPPFPHLPRARPTSFPLSLITFCLQFLSHAVLYRPVPRSPVTLTSTTCARPATTPRTATWTTVPTLPPCPCRGTPPRTASSRGSRRPSRQWTGIRRVGRKGGGAGVGPIPRRRLYFHLALRYVLYCNYMTRGCPAFLGRERAAGDALGRGLLVRCQRGEGRGERGGP
jgi:hypothetical protein